MEVTQNLLDYIKRDNRDFHALVDIRPYDGYVNKTHTIDFISIEYPHVGFDAPRITYKTIYMDLKSIIRECKIDSFLNFKEPETDFDVESIIYTSEQRDRLALLRKESDKNIINSRTYGFTELTKTRVEYSQSFEVGERVYYNKSKGIITFKHFEKENSEKEQRWTVKIGDTEYRYVYGTSLRKRKVEDLSHIPIDKELNKLSTEKLLKIFRKTRVRGVGNIKIKRILYDREHFQKGETKIKM
jgi:hypothetical protein